MKPYNRRGGGPARRRSAVLLALSAVLAGVGAVEGGAAPSSSGPANDFVLASFDDQYGTHYDITAWSGPGGEEPRGRVQLSFANFRGRVACLAVHGHEALVIAVSREQFAVFTALVRDNRRGTDELLFAELRQGRKPRDCPVFDGTDGRPGEPVEGDISIHDA